MANGSGGGGGGAALGVVVGGLVVAVAVMGVVMFSGGLNPSKNINVNIHPPAISAPGK
jgi:hypothetical protein